MKIFTTSGKLNKRTITVLAVVFWLAVWQAVSMIANDLIVASPAEVLTTLGSLCVTADFWATIARSFFRIVLGFALSVVAGCALAALSAFTWADALISPPMRLIKATPVASFVILLLLMFSSRYLSTAICFLMVLPVIYFNVLSGIKNADQKLLEMARVFSFKPREKMKHIYIPAIRPHFISAVKISLGLCFKSGVAAEVIGLPSGTIGEKLYMAKIYLSTGELFAWTLVIIVISALFERVVLRAIGGKHDQA